MCVQSSCYHQLWNNTWEVKIQARDKQTVFFLPIDPRDEVGQYFITKDTDDFGQFRSVACREYTLPRDDESSQPRGWIQGIMRIGPVLEVTTSYMYGKHGIEIRIWSLSEDNSHSWVRISYGTTKYVVVSIQDNTEIPVDPTRRANFTNKLECGCSQVKGKSKTSTESTRWYNSNHTNARKKMD